MPCATSACGTGFSLNHNQSLRAATKKIMRRYLLKLSFFICFLTEHSLLEHRNERDIKSESHYQLPGVHVTGSEKENIIFILGSETTAYMINKRTLP